MHPWVRFLAQAASCALLVLATGSAGARTVTLDAANSRLEVLTSASAEQVAQALQHLECAARLLEQPAHISGGSTCCGSCG